MNVFSISDMESLSGIKAHTLRIWEHRYKILIPKRKASSHRTYDNEDLKSILRITYLYNKGYKISKIAALTPEQISKLTLQLQPGSDNFDIFINQLTEASLDFDQVKFEKILHNLVLHIGFEKSIMKVLFPLMNRIGILWMVNDVSPAQEHFASDLIMKKIITAIDGLEKSHVKTQGANVLLFTPEKEFHEIPILMMHYLLRKNGISTTYVGSNSSVDTIADYVQARPVTHLYFHVITYLVHTNLGDYLKQLRLRFPEKKIVYSGAMMADLPDTPPGIRYLSSAEEMNSFAAGDL